MIAEKRLNLIVNSKVGWLTRYYMDIFKYTPQQSYIYIRDSGVIDILKKESSRLYLEPVDLIKESIDIYYSQGKEEMDEYLKLNIG